MKIAIANGDSAVQLELTVDEYLLLSDLEQDLELAEESEQQKAEELAKASAELNRIAEENYKKEQLLAVLLQHHKLIGGTHSNKTLNGIDHYQLWFSAFKLRKELGL